MKHIFAAALILAPALASASLSPVSSEAETHRLHLTQFAWTTISAPVGPGCTDPTPEPATMTAQFACVVPQAK